jgi:hypothetical protein
LPVNHRPSGGAVDRRVRDGGGFAGVGGVAVLEDPLAALPCSAVLPRAISWKRSWNLRMPPVTPPYQIVRRWERAWEPERGEIILL